MQNPNENVPVHMNGGYPPSDGSSLPSSPLVRRGVNRDALAQLDLNNREQGQVMITWPRGEVPYAAPGQARMYSPQPLVYRDPHQANAFAAYSPPFGIGETEDGLPQGHEQANPMIPNVTMSGNQGDGPTFGGPPPTSLTFQQHAGILQATQHVMHGPLLAPSPGGMHPNDQLGHELALEGSMMGTPQMSPTLMDRAGHGPRPVTRHGSDPGGDVAMHSPTNTPRQLSLVTHGAVAGNGTHERGRYRSIRGSPRTPGAPVQVHLPYNSPVGETLRQGDANTAWSTPSSAIPMRPGARAHIGDSVHHRTPDLSGLGVTTPTERPHYHPYSPGQAHSRPHGGEPRVVHAPDTGDADLSTIQGQAESSQPPSPGPPPSSRGGRYKFKARGLDRRDFWFIRAMYNNNPFKSDKAMYLSYIDITKELKNNPVCNGTFDSLSESNTSRTLQNRFMVLKEIGKPQRWTPVEGLTDEESEELRMKLHSLISDDDARIASQQAEQGAKKSAKTSALLASDLRDECALASAQNHRAAAAAGPLEGPAESEGSNIPGPETEEGAVTVGEIQRPRAQKRTILSQAHEEEVARVSAEMRALNEAHVLAQKEEAAGTHKMLAADLALGEKTFRMTNAFKNRELDILERRLEHDINSDNKALDQMGLMKTELKEDIAAVKAGEAEKIDDLKAELKGDIAGIRGLLEVIAAQGTSRSQSDSQSGYSPQV